MHNAQNIVIADQTLATIHARSCHQADSQLAALPNRTPVSPGIDATKREVRASLDTIVFITRDVGRRHIGENLTRSESE